MAHACVKRIASAASILGDSRAAKRHQMSLLLADSDPNDLLREQGDLRFYSNNELAKRADIRHAPEILRLLEKWWMGAKHTVDDDDGDSDTLNKKEYAAFYWRLVAAFNDDDDDENDISETESIQALEADWANDSHGDNYVDKEEFFDSVFELADQWCDTSTIDEYVDFLARLYDKLFRGAEHWRNCRAARLVIHKHGHKFDVNKFKSFDMSTYLTKLRSVAHLGIGGALAWRRASSSCGAESGVDLSRETGVGMGNVNRMEMGGVTGAQKTSTPGSVIEAGGRRGGEGAKVYGGPQGNGCSGLHGDCGSSKVSVLGGDTLSEDERDSHARRGGPSARFAGAKGQQQLAFKCCEGDEDMTFEHGSVGSSGKRGDDIALLTGGRLGVDVNVYGADDAGPFNENGAPAGVQGDAHDRSSLFASPSQQPNAGGGGVISGVAPGNGVANASAIMQTALGHDQHIQNIDRESTGVGRNPGIGSCSSDPVFFRTGAIAYVSEAMETDSLDSVSGKTGAMRHWGRTYPAALLLSRKAGNAITSSRPPGPHTLVRRMLRQSGQLQENIRAKASSALRSPSIGGDNLTYATDSSGKSGARSSAPVLQYLGERASPGGGRDPGRTRLVSRGHQGGGLHTKRKGSSSQKVPSRLQTRSLALNSASGMLVVSPFVRRPGSRALKTEHPRRFHLVCEGRDPADNRYFPSKTGLASGNWACDGAT